MINQEELLKLNLKCLLDNVISSFLLQHETLEWEEKRQKINEICKILEILKQQPFGSSVDNIDMGKLEKVLGREISSYYRLWLLVEEYILNKLDVELKYSNLLLLHEELKKIRTASFQEDGRGLLPKEINREFIRNVYLTDNAELIDIFAAELPIPGIEVFAGFAVPDFIVQREKIKAAAMLEFMRRNPDVQAAEQKVIALQRRIRRYQRNKEDIARIANMYYVRYNEDDDSITLKANAKPKAKALLAAANTPYLPKCNPVLAQRIFTAAKQITLFDTVKHLTAAAAVTNILDGALYGRRTLLQHYMPFRPAALMSCDIDDGDSNVICFGPGEIDPMCMKNNTYEFTFDMPKLIRNNPVVFFKQCDLGFGLDRYRTVKIKDMFLKFSHTSYIRCGLPRHTNLQLFGADGLLAYSELPNCGFISFNTASMQQILILNFFKFLDTLRDVQDRTSFSNKAAIYADIEKLNAQELAAFLLNLGKNMTDTAEFNFYGAHQIDFSSIKDIACYRESGKQAYSLNLASFVCCLNRGDLDTLAAAKSNLPEIFNSERFVAYLQAQVSDVGVKAALGSKKQVAAATLQSAWRKFKANKQPLEQAMVTVSVTGDVASVSNKPL